MTERNSKRYYWLKLNENFFERDEIKVIESMKNGKDYIIFYMKLLLKSVGTEGKLRFREVIPYTPEMLSSITNTDIDTVKVAIDMFSKLGLMDIWDDGTLFMSETQSMIGSETGWAKKKRNQRDKEDIVPLEKDNVPSLSLKSPIEIDKEIEIEIDKDKDKDKEVEKTPNSLLNSSEFKEIAQLYQQIIGQANSLTAEWIEGHLEEYGFEWLKNALIVAEEQGKRNKSYVNGILKNWKTEGGMKKGDGASGANNGDNSNSKGKGGKEEIDWAERSGVTSF